MLKKICEFCFSLPRQDSPLRGVLHNIIPGSMFKAIKYFRGKLYPFTESIRIKKSVTKFLGPEFPPLHNRIEINITYRCNMRCLYCNRFLDIAPSKEEMSVEQIKKFIDESIRADRKWESIMLSGGEPTLHPQILDIVNLVIEYKKNFSPSTIVHILTNGTNKVRLSALPADISIIDSQKDILGIDHVPIAVAPFELDNYKDADFSNGCCFPPLDCGIGLNPYGYYQCTGAADIDRIFGFDMGMKKLPSTQDNMVEFFRMFCRYCGFFIRTARSRRSRTITPAWEKAIEKYLQSRPPLTLY